MKLRVGLTAPSSPWDQILSREGIPSVRVDLRDPDTLPECSAFVVAAPLDAETKPGVEAILRHGNGVLGYSAYLDGVCGFTSRMQRVRFIEPRDSRFAAGSGLLDIDGKCAIPREAQHWRTDDQSAAIFAGGWGGGFVVALPFDPATGMSDTRAASRRFPFSSDRLPSERVSAVGKGEMRHVLHAALEYLHHARGLPFAHLWYYPDGKRNLLALRIDTDGAPREDVDALGRIGERYGVPMTWCLDVRAHEAWLDRFVEMRSGEKAVHCYEHRIFVEHAAQRADIAHALAVMRRAGLSPAGFAAPYGIWTEVLPAILEDMGFDWSSEFSYLYDALPWYPERGGTRSPVLQIPVHPICVGSLRKAGYTPGQMKAYFRTVVSRKLLLDEPLFFYHHPTHRHDEVIGDLLGFALEGGGTPVTMGEMAAWWKSRSGLRPAFEVDGGTLTCGLEGERGAEAAVHVRVTLPDRREAVVPWRSGVRLDDPGAFAARPIPPPSDDLRRSREFDLRSALGHLYTTLQRRFR